MDREALYTQVWAILRDSRLTRTTHREGGSTHEAVHLPRDGQDTHGLCGRRAREFVNPDTRSGGRFAGPGFVRISAHIGGSP